MVGQDIDRQIRQDKTDRLREERVEREMGN